MSQCEVEETAKLMQSKRRRVGEDGSMGRGHWGENPVELPGLTVCAAVFLGETHRDIPGRVK